MRRRRIAFLALTTVVFVASGWLGLRIKFRDPESASVSSNLTANTATSLPMPNSQISPTGRNSAVQKTLAMLGTPIVFYGKVIDQYGAPIAEATVDYGTIDRFDAEGSKYVGKSDAQGAFSISGIKGAVLTVGVRKPGYYNIQDKSDGSFAYGVGADPTRRAPPSKDAPAIFILQKMGATEPLIQISSRQFLVSTSGQPLTIDLSSGSSGHGQLQIESWIGPMSGRQFDWRFRVSVQGGGLIERINPFDFEAPNQGYVDQLDIQMPANRTAWSSDVQKNYFLKLANGQYARATINFYPGNRNFIVLESYLNPTPGSRNLEFDPAKQIATGKN